MAKVSAGGQKHENQVSKFKQGPLKIQPGHHRAHVPLRDVGVLIEVLNGAVRINDDSQHSPAVKRHRVDGRLPAVDSHREHVLLEFRV